MQNISNERHQITDRLATLIAQHHSELAAAQKTLFDDQMTLLKSASDANAARDNAVVDLVKARLISTPSEPKPLPVPCALDGTQVKNVQAVLVEYLLYRRQPDGLWGPHTENGVSRFQSRLNLPVTGYIDQGTATRLGIPCKSP
jgi:peptidoglycan hydrolase-like protein with peptidoglycan-binding domain